MIQDRRWFSVVIILIIITSGSGCGGGNGNDDAGETGSQRPPAMSGVPPLQLDTLNQHASLHVLAVNRAGDLAVVWQANRVGSDQLLVTLSRDGESWRPSEVWADVEFVFLGDVMGELLDTQEVILVWEDQTRILAQTQPRAAGGIPEILAERGEIPSLTRVPTAQASAIALWREDRPLQIAAYPYLPDTDWSVPESVPLLSTQDLQDDPNRLAAAPLQAELGAAADGTRMVMWRDFAEMQAVRRVPGLGWEEPMHLRDTDRLIGDFALAMSANGTALAIWCEQTPLGLRNLVGAHFNGQVWTPVVVVAEAQCPALDPELHLQMDDEGDGVALWASGSVYAVRFRAGQWESPQVLSEDGGNAQLSVHPSGATAVVWLEGSALESPQNQLVMRGCFDPSSDWTPTEVLIERFDLYGSVVLRVAAGPDGNVVAVWDTELGELWRARSTLQP
jgi:hypothetical protein